MYRTGKKRYTGVYRKRRTARATRYPSVSARKMHMSLPNRQRVTLRCNEQVTVSYLSVQGFDGFFYPLWFPGLWKDTQGVAPRFAGGFLPLIQLYSKAYVRGVRCHARCMAINNGTNCNLNLYSMIVPELHALSIGSLTNVTSFEDASNTFLAKKHYIGQSAGGLPYTHDYRSVDLTKYQGFGKIQDNAMFRNPLGTITAPSAGEADYLPAYVWVVYNPPGSAAAEVLFEFTFDFDVEFMDLTMLPQLIANQPVLSFARRT